MAAMKGGRKYAKIVNAGDGGHMMSGGGTHMAGTKTRSYGSGEPTRPKARGGTMAGGSTPGVALTTQGDKSGGMSAGKSRTMRGANRIGAGRQQTTRG